MMDDHGDSVIRGTVQFLPIDRIVYGPGVVQRLPEALDRLGLRRALIITGSSISTATPLLHRIEQLLGRRCAATYTGVRQHVPGGAVAEAVQLARTRAVDCLVSVGGSSPIDAAKAV